jgi:outer membrane protein OmpA-like peptidoglycan-associated protein
MRVQGIALALSLTMATAAGAQSSGAFEINGFGRYTKFDDTLNLDDKVGGGGSLGIFLLKNLALEAEGAYTKTDGPLGTSVSNTPLRGRLTYHIPLGGYGSAIRLGGGYVRNMYREDQSFDDDGVTGVVGIRLGVGEKFGFLIDGTVDYAPSPDADRADNYMNIGGQAGLSFLFGNSYDKDKDTVKDKADRCPGTAKGKAVDATGCSADQRDTDRDTVNDETDGCPHTPAGETVDARGCAPSQKDADQDRVMDTLDRCKATPTGESVDPEGCSSSQKDDDKDLVMNSADQCADTPAGAPVDPRGCPRDSDADGITDALDQCPGTPNGQAVDEKGCPVLFQPGAKTVALQGVTFATGKASLTPESEVVLRDVARQLAASPGTRVQVSGYTDNSGSRATNTRLSQQRAEAVERFLEANGVSPAQVTAKGFGPANPVASNKTAAGRAKNRRVELTRIE